MLPLKGPSDGERGRARPEDRLVFKRRIDCADPPVTESSQVDPRGPDPGGHPGATRDGRD